MHEDSTFGFKGFAMLFALLVIVLAGSQSEPGGRFDLLTKIVRKVPPGKVVKSPTTTTPISTSPTPIATAPTTTTPTTTDTSNTLYTELTAVSSSFDPTTSLVASWGSGGIAASSAPDPVGAFRFICGAGHLLRDDPIVYPGQPGKSHLHQFYGNLSVDAGSTYASLRQNGGSSCEFGNGSNAVNRSAYWMPAMLDGKGNVVRPDYISIYYKRRPITDPKCSLTSGDPRAEGDCVPLPNGLRFVFGYDMLTNKAPTGSFSFNCDGPTAVAGHYATITQAMANCPTAPTNGVYNRLGAVIAAPSCWDGKNLDSANHRDHVAYMVLNGYTGLWACPPTHPKLIPSFQLGAWYTIDANLGTWRLSSDEMMPGAAPGSTFHADWFGGWDNQVQAMWMDNCINKQLNCSGGDLGNGKQIRGAGGPPGWVANPRLVPIPS